jgi:predicted transcriptional regulator
MFELSHPERLKILHILDEKPMRLSHISKELDITTAEVSRHLDRLGNARLIERDPDSNYNLTPFAIIVLSEMANFDFLIENVEYFLSHDMVSIPDHLHWYNAMSKGEFRGGTLEISSMIKETSANAKKYVYVMSEEVMRVLVELDCQKHDSGVIFKKIYPKGTDFPPEYMDRLDDTFQLRTMEKLPLALKMNEKIAGVALHDMSGKVDLSMGLVGEEESFRKWVGAIFDYYWGKAKSVV